MILGLGAPELIVILIVVLVIFGPKNLPKLGKSLGETVKNVREGMEGDDDDDSKKLETSEEAPAKDAADSDADVDSDADADVDADADADVTFCPKCGTSNPSTSDFCSKCGSKLINE